MATYRQIRIAPDMPAREDGSDVDTPPASPYRNRIPSKRPSIRVGNFLTLTLPRPQTFVTVGLILLSIGWLFAPREYKPRLIKPTHEPGLRYKNVDWRMFAYTMFAADADHLCSSLMVFEQLDKLGSKADRVLFYPQDWETHPEHKPSQATQLLKWAKGLYNVQLRPVKVHGYKLDFDSEPRGGRHRYDLPDGEGRMDPSATKFMAISEIDYLRVIHLESHISLRQHLDELFLGPEARMALTRNYLTNPTTKQLSAHFFMVTPRKEDAESVLELASSSEWSNDHFDSQILTEYYSDQAMLLSHRRFGLNAVEFRRENHLDFLGNEWEDWYPEQVMREATMIVFDEEPIPKPWVDMPAGHPDDYLPPCDFGPDSDRDISCRNRVIWTSLYSEYKNRRKQICRLLPVPGGRWKDPKQHEATEEGSG